jgi:uncharacterized protein (TIRG00374 family)
MEFNFGKIIKKLIFAFIITVFLFGAVIALDDFKSTFRVLKGADFRFLFAALLMLAVFMVLNIYVLYALLKSRNCDVSAKDVFLIGGAEPFFNGITPFSTGGQPFQAYALYKKGVPLDVSATALMMNFIIYMVPTNLFALLSLVFFQKFVTEVPGFVSVAIIGFAINFVTVVFFLACAFSDSFRKKMAAFVRYLSKKKLFRKLLHNKAETFNNFLKNVQNGCNALLCKPKVFILCILAKVVGLMVYYAIPFAFIKALHVPISFVDIFYIMLGTSFAITMVVWVPTPGSAGGIELAFKSIFATISGVTPVIASSGMILWRLYTYYLLMLVGFVCYIIFELTTKNRGTAQTKKAVK